MMTRSTTTDSPDTRLLFGFLPWPSEVSGIERNALIAGSVAWMGESLVVMLFSLVIANLMKAFSITKAMAGTLNSLTLAATAVGGLMFGVFADRVGRKRALIYGILLFSLASAGSGLSQSLIQLAVCRLLVGVGMGGVWTTAAALVAESWRPTHRGKALGLMQSSAAIGNILAVALSALILPRLGWRAVFVVGVLPSLAIFWIHRNVAESALWKVNQKATQRWDELLQAKVIRNGLIATFMNALTMFGFWGLYTWIPSYLSMPVAQGGRGLSQGQAVSSLIIMWTGQWFGFAMFGFLSDWLGRRVVYAGYLIMAAALVPLYGMTTSPSKLLLLGPLVAFFGSGYFSGYAAIASELFPTSVRASAMGLTYNIGRLFSALAPIVIGLLAAKHGLGSAFIVLSGAFLLAALLVVALPETRGKSLAATATASA